MGFLYLNAYIDVVSELGIVKYVQRHVQVDDIKSHFERKIDHIPYIQKTIFDKPSTRRDPILYARGDKVTITSMDGQDLILADNVFYVVRSFPSGNPLPYTNVLVEGGRITNATCSTTRLNKLAGIQSPVLTNTRVTYAMLNAEKITTYGAEVTTTIYADPDTDWAEDDIVTFSRLDGHNNLDVKRSYTVKQIMRDPTPVPHLHISITGAVQ